MGDNPIQLAVIDMAGTTVADDGLVVSAFEAAATAAGLPESGPERDDARQYVLDTMGQSKIIVFRALFGTEELAQRANAAFERAYSELDRRRAAPSPSTVPPRRSRACATPASRWRSPRGSAGRRRRSCWPPWAGSRWPTWCWHPATGCVAVLTRT